MYETMTVCNILQKCDADRGISRYKIFESYVLHELRRHACYLPIIYTDRLNPPLRIELWRAYKAARLKVAAQTV